jgi:hypothetical protein
MSKSEISTLNNIRICISNDKMKDAFDIIKQNTLFSNKKNDFILLENQFNNWNTNFLLGLSPSEHVRSRITYALLTFLSEKEKEINDSLKVKTQLAVEKDILDKYNKITSLEKPPSTSDEVLLKISKFHPVRFDQLKALTAESIKTKGDIEDFDELISLWALEIIEHKIIEPHHLKIITSLLKDSPKTLLQLLNGIRHRKANVRLLENIVSLLEAKYEKLKAAGFAGIIGMAIGSWLSDSNSIVKDFDDQGYDKNGFDFDGYDKNGFNENSEFFIDGFSSIDYGIDYGDGVDMIDNPSEN